MQVLIASRNSLPAVPHNLHLPLLRELWLGSNRLGEMQAWPWLPSLQVVRLEDNQLSRLAPMQARRRGREVPPGQKVSLLPPIKCDDPPLFPWPLQQGFPQLQALDLSFNRLASLEVTLAALAPLATLHQLRLNDNPLQAAVAEGRWGEWADENQLQISYREAVLHALPQLQELDSQPVGEAQRQQHKQAAVRQRPPVRPVPAGTEQALSRHEWQAQTTLWLLAHPSTAELVQQAEAQQQALAGAAEQQAAEGEPPPVPGAEDLAAVLAGLRRAAAAGPTPSQLHPGAASAATGSSQTPLQQAQQLYLLLAGGPAAAQNLLLLNPAIFQERLTQLHAAATRIQAAWRCCAARHLRQHLSAERQARRQTAAAGYIQAAWRGWACRECRHRWVQARLAGWRQEWGEAQRQLLEHQRCYAATRIQAGQGRLHGGGVGCLHALRHAL